MTIAGCKQITEIATAWISVIALIVAGVFTGVQYLDKKRDDQVRETLDFLDRYNTGGVFEARRAIMTAWKSHAAEEARLLQPRVPAQAFHDYVMRVITDEKLALPIATMHDFYQALQVCVSNDICARDVAVGLFRADARSMYTRHYPFIQAERRRRRDPSVGEALEAIGKL